jgi:hypothetical protein
MRVPTVERRRSEADRRGYFCHELAAHSASDRKQPNGPSPPITEVLRALKVLKVLKVHFA